MELWIRSQDKAILQKVNRLYVCKCAEEKGYGIYDLLYNDLDDCDVPLGFYKTRDRALEILDAIQKKMTINESINGNYQEQDLYIKALYIEKSRLIYQMPEE